MKLKLGLFLCALALITASCKNSGLKKTATGLEYKIYTDNKGAKPKEGDILKFNLIVKYSDSKVKDSVLFNSYKNGKPAMDQLRPSQYKGDFAEGLAMLSKNDSALFVVNTDSIPAQQRPPFFKPGGKLYFTVKMVDITDKAAYQMQMQQEAMVQTAKDTMIITDYLKKNNLKAQRTGDGIYYIIEKQGEGDFPQAGQNVTVNYKGYFTNGQVFDQSEGKGQPFTFPIGKHQVIPGWDLGMMVFKKGGKGKLFVPSAMAYGAQGNRMIPPNSVLIFDVELVDIAAASPDANSNNMGGSK